MKLHEKIGMAGLLAGGIVLGLSVSGAALAAPEQAAACAACHGEDGNSTQPVFPKLAGQPKEYLAKQLNEYVSGKRKNDMMSPLAGNLKPGTRKVPGDVEVLASYYSAQKPTSGAAQDKKLAEEGKKIYFNGNEATDVAVCSACHQQNAEGTRIYPRLAGQHAEYLYQQLKSYGSGERNNDISRVMRVVAKHMTEQEMRAVAEYLSGL
jgi:cytochrome c553